MKLRSLFVLPFFLISCSSEEVSPSDMPLFITYSDLAPYGIYDLGIGEEDFQAAESMKRTRMFDDSLDLEYSLHSSDMPVMIQVNVGYEVSESDAETSMNAMKWGIRTGLRIGQVEMEEDYPFEWGEDAFFYWIKEDDEIVGQFYGVREELNFYIAMIIGIPMPISDFEQLVTPKLEYMQNYHPDDEII